MKKIVSFLLASCLLALLSFPASADKPSYYAVDSNYPDYHLTLLVDDLTFEINDYVGNDSEISIPSKLGGMNVTAIGESAFEYCDAVSITIPDTVKSIGKFAFHSCTSLTNIKFPDSVTTIEYSAFDYCESLTAIDLPDSLTTIESWTFSNCSSLTDITIPESVTTIEDAAFEYCTSLTSITLPDSVTEIGDGVFDYCDNLTAIVVRGSYAEQYCKENAIDYIYSEETVPEINTVVTETSEAITAEPDTTKTEPAGTVATVSEPAADAWTCENGHAGNTGNFCGECGAPKPEYPLGCCPACGYDFAGTQLKFCPNCGLSMNAEELYATANDYFDAEDYDAAIKFLARSAELGYEEAQFTLGYCYENGVVLTQNNEKAFEWYTKAAEQGFPKAQGKVGISYYQGDIVEQNYYLAVKWCKRASDQFHFGARYYLGLCYENGFGVPQDYNMAAEWYSSMASIGYPPAQEALERVQQKAGSSADAEAAVPLSFETLLEKGEYENAAKEAIVHVEEPFLNAFASEDRYELYVAGEECYTKYTLEHDEGELSRACQLYLKAAERGYPEAQYKLASIYTREQNYSEAYRWASEAAKHECPDAYYVLSYMYLNGLGVEKSEEDAEYWKARFLVLMKRIEELANNSTEVYPEDLCWLGSSYRTGRFVEKDITKAIFYFTKAAEQEDATAARLLGDTYSSTFYGVEDLSLAIEWYKKAYELGDDYAGYELALIYRSYYVDDAVKDPKKAVEILQELADKGMVSAQKELADIYCWGDYRADITANQVMEFEWRLKAAAQDDAGAEYDIGHTIENGLKFGKELLFPGNKELAKVWYIRAAENGNSFAQDELDRLNTITD